MLNRTAIDLITTDSERALRGRRFAIRLPDGEWMRNGSRYRVTYRHRSDAIAAAERVGGQVCVVRHSPPSMRIVYV